jgi:hypothetical protein
MQSINIGSDVKTTRYAQSWIFLLYFFGNCESLVTQNATTTLFTGGRYFVVGWNFVEEGFTQISTNVCFVSFHLPHGGLGCIFCELEGFGPPPTFRWTCVSPGIDPPVVGPSRPETD